MKTPALLVAAAVLTACAAGRDYQRPAAPTGAEGAFVSSAPGVVAGEAPVDRFWTLFGSTELDALVDEALSANRDLRAASANLEASEALLRESRSRHWPSTTLSAGTSFGRNVQPAFQPQEEWYRQAGAQVDYELDVFGRVRRSIEAARADASAERHARDAVALRVAVATVDAYLTACTTSEAIATVKESVELSGESLRITEAKERAGSASTLDAHRARAQVAQARATLAPLQAQRQSALFELAALLGRPPAQVPESAARCAVAPPAPESFPVGDGASLLRRRPDVAEAERRLAAATARAGVATADLYPKVTIGGSVSRTFGGGLTRERGLSFGVGPLLSISLPNNAAARARLAQSEAQTRAQLARFDGAVLGALKETEQALNGYATGLERASALRDAEAESSGAFERSDQLYRTGATSNLDLVIAQGDFVGARLARVQSDLTLVRERLRLFEALGGGWAEPAEGAR